MGVAGKRREKKQKGVPKGRPVVEKKARQEGDEGGKKKMGDSERKPKNRGKVKGTGKGRWKKEKETGGSEQKDGGGGEKMVVE